MELSSLRAPRPVPPRLSVGDQRIHTILRDLEKIKFTKPRKRVKRCEKLVYFVSQALRKSSDDTLLHSTAIWVLITIFRMFPVELKDHMLQAGVPGVLYEIIKKGAISGSSRKYASELCFYLSSNHPYPMTNEDDGPMKKLPEVEVPNRYQPDLDDISIMSDVSSTNDKQMRKAFVPYRIDETNMEKMDALFEQGYGSELAASLPNQALISIYGFSDKQVKASQMTYLGANAGVNLEFSSDSEDSQEGGDNIYDDDDTISSTLSSGTRSRGLSISSSEPGLFTNLKKSVKFPSNNTKNLLLNRQPTTQFSKLKSNNYDDDISIGSHSSTSSKRKLNGSAPSGSKQAHFSLAKLETRQINSASANLFSTSTPAFSFQNSPTQLSPERKPYINSMTSISPSIESQSVRSTPFKTMLSSQAISVENVFERSGLIDPAISLSKIQKTASVDAFFSEVDPLALSGNNNTGKEMKSKKKKSRYPNDETGFYDNTGLASDVEDENNEDEWEFSDDESENEENDDNEIDWELDEEDQQNPFMKQKKMRIRAEKLIDHNFIKKLFTQKTTLAQTQDLIKRMENLLQIIDSENTGYVTFEQFTRLLLAISPAHLVRHDVQNFLQNQTDDINNFIDYKEFIITGKVLILTKLQKMQYLKYKNQLVKDERNRKILNGKNPAKKKKTGLNEDSVVNYQNAEDLKETFDYRNEITSTLTWLKRQKNYHGDDTTYTWKNHLKWYEKRKSVALIWLIRRSVRALNYEKKLLAAQKLLMLDRQKAFAITYLMEVGKNALSSQFQRKDAKRHLLKRVIHARKFIVRINETFRSLKIIGERAKDEMILEENYQEFKRKEKERQEEEVKKSLVEEENRIYYQKLHEASSGSSHSRVETLNKTLNFNQFYKIYHIQMISYKYLKIKAQKALNHSSFQDKAFNFLFTKAQKIKNLLYTQDKIQYELRMRSELALLFLEKQEQSLLGLIRLGNKAFRHIKRQEDAIEYLFNKGKDSLSFLDHQSNTSDYLYALGQRTLRLLNLREYSFEYLRNRCVRAERFIIRKQEATEFLRMKPYGLWKIIDKCHEAQDWLVARAERAKDYLITRHKSQQYLKFIAGKATNTFRKSLVAFHELCQFGMMAKFQTFKLLITKVKPLKRQFIEEKQRLKKILANQVNIRLRWDEKDRFQIEFMEMYQLIAKVYTPIQIIELMSSGNSAINNKIKRINLLRQIDNLSKTHFSPSKVKIEENVPRSPVLTLSPRLNFEMRNTMTSTQSTIQNERAQTSLSGPRTRFGFGDTNSSSLATTNVKELVNQGTFNDYGEIVDTNANGNTSETSEKIAYLGKYGFRILAKQGKLFQVSVDRIDEEFRNLDIASSCYISDKEALPWFIKKYFKVNKNYQLRVSDVLTIDERCAMILWNRSLKDKEFFDKIFSDTNKPRKSLYDEYLQKMYERDEARKRNNNNLGFDSDEEEEDDEEEIEDEDAFFSDIERLKNMDVGRLMKYLTKKRLSAEARAALEGKLEGFSTKQDANVDLSLLESTKGGNDLVKDTEKKIDQTPNDISKEIELKTVAQGSIDHNIKISNALKSLASAEESAKLAHTS